MLPLLLIEPVVKGPVEALTAGDQGCQRCPGAETAEVLREREFRRISDP